MSSYWGTYSVLFRHSGGLPTATASVLISFPATVSVPDSGYCSEEVILVNPQELTETCRDREMVWGRITSHNTAPTDPEEQLEIPESHPFFTRGGPSCGHQFNKQSLPPVQWDCPACGWIDDSV